MGKKKGLVFLRAFTVLAGVICLLLLTACGILGGSSSSTTDPSTVGESNTPIPPPTTELGSEVAVAEIPTPTLAPKRKVTEIENRVLASITGCARELAIEMGQNIAPDFTVEYNAADGAWFAEAYSRSPNLELGKWQVSDATGAITPKDDTAKNISSPELSCVTPLPKARGRTPPQFGIPTPTPKPTPTPTTPPPDPVAPTPIPRKIEEASDAAVQVWITMYSCYGHYPLLASFSATEEGKNRWSVEGRSADTVYGLWSVDAVTGEITPADVVALNAQQECDLTPEVPVVLDAEQAALRVWMASYQCFEPRPKAEFFTGHQINPQRWIVEGREVQKEATEGALTVENRDDRLYGFWRVDADTATIEPWDLLAQRMAASPCFNPP